MDESGWLADCVCVCVYFKGICFNTSAALTNLSMLYVACHGEGLKFLQYLMSFFLPLCKSDNIP